MNEWIIQTKENVKDAAGFKAGQVMRKCLEGFLVKCGSCWRFSSVSSCHFLQWRWQRQCCRGKHRPTLVNSQRFPESEQGLTNQQLFEFKNTSAGCTAADVL